MKPDEYDQEKVFQTFVRYYADHIVQRGNKLDKKRLRFNDIVNAAKIIYPYNEFCGIRELIESIIILPSEELHTVRDMWCDSMMSDYNMEQNIKSTNWMRGAL